MPALLLVCILLVGPPYCPWLYATCIGAMFSALRHATRPFWRELHFLITTFHTIYKYNSYPITHDIFILCFLNKIILYIQIVCQVSQWHELCQLLYGVTAYMKKTTGCHFPDDMAIIWRWYHHDDHRYCQVNAYQWPLLLTWFDFNPSMDK